MENGYEISDARTKKDFARITFSGYKKKDTENQLKKAILENKVEQAQYWCAEIICTGDFDKLWEIIYLLASKHIHIANPRVFPYLRMKYDCYESIRSMGYRDYELSMRNHRKVRECFAEVICVLCASSKMPVLTPLKMKKEELSILNLQGRLQATTTEHGKYFLKRGDPEEILVAINELAYICFERNNEYINKLYDALFWLHWVLSYEEHCRKNEMSLECAPRQTSDTGLAPDYRTDIIWIIWDVIFESNLTVHNHTANASTPPTRHYVSQNENYKRFIHRILESLLFFFKQKFTNSCKKRKITLIYLAFQLLFMPIDTSVKLLSDDARVMTDTVKENIDVVYKRIKESEKRANTDYLFDGVDKEQNLDNTMRRLELMSSMELVNK